MYDYDYDYYDYDSFRGPWSEIYVFFWDFDFKSIE